MLTGSFILVAYSDLRHWPCKKIQTHQNVITQCRDSPVAGAAYGKSSEGRGRLMLTTGWVCASSSEEQEPPRGRPARLQEHNAPSSGGILTGRVL